MKNTFWPCLMPAVGCESNIRGTKLVSHSCMLDVDCFSNLEKVFSPKPNPTLSGLLLKGTESDSGSPEA